MIPEESDRSSSLIPSAHPKKKMSASVRVLRDGSKLVGANLTSTLLSVLLSVTLIRLLSKTELSVIPISQILVAMVATISSFGLPASAIRLIPGAIERGERPLAVWLMRTTLISSFVLSVLLCAILWATAPWVAKLILKSSEEADTIVLMIPAVFFGVLAQSVSLMTMAGQRFSVQAIMNIVIRIGQPTGAVVFFVFFGFKGLILGLALASLVAALVGVFGLRDFIFADAQKKSFRQHLRFSFPYYLNDWVRFASMNADQTIIAILLGPSALATYYVGKRFAGYIFTLTTAMSGPILPQLARVHANGEEAVARALRTTSRYLFLILIPVTLGSSAIAFPFIAVAAGERYTAAVPVFIALCLAEVAYATYGVYDQSIFVIRRPRDTLLLGISTAVLALLTTTCLAMWFGGIGAAVARGVSFGLGALVGSRIIRRAIPIRPDWSTMGTVILACIPMVAFVVLAQWVFYSTWLLPCYILLGAIVLLPCHARLWTAKDLQLAHDVLPSALRKLVGVLAWFSPPKERMAFARGLKGS